MVDWALAAAILTPILACIGVVAGAWVGRRAGVRQADAAVKSAEASARQAVTADWKAYTDSLYQWATGLADRLTAVEARAGAAERRLDAAETRTVLAENRAERAEEMYRVAIRYVRRLVAWVVDQNRLDEPMPIPPPEIENDVT